MKTFLALFVAMCGLNLSAALYIPTTFWPSDNDYDLYELTKKYDQYESNEDRNIFSTLFDENDDETSNKNNHEHNLDVSAELTNTNEDLTKEIDFKKSNDEVNNEARDSENTENNDHEKDNDQNDSTNANIDENSNEVAVDDNKSVSVGHSTSSLSYDTKKEEEMAKMLQEIDELYTLWKRVYDRNGVIKDILEEKVEIFKSLVLKKDLSASDFDASNKNENEKNKNDNVKENNNESNTNDDARSDNDYITFTINNDIEATDIDPTIEFDFVAINDDKIENDSSATADPSQFYYHTILEQ